MHGEFVNMDYVIMQLNEEEGEGEGREEEEGGYCVCRNEEHAVVAMFKF